MIDRIVRFLKKLLLWGILPLSVLIVLFFMGEQFEVGRLSAVATCESNTNKAACIRSKGYLAEPPYYPDLGRRYLAALARFVGGDLGASYREEAAAPAPAAAPAKSAPAAAPRPAAPALPLPAR